MPTNENIAIQKKSLNVEEVINALMDLGGVAHLRDIYKQIIKRNIADFSKNNNPEAFLREILQTNSLSTAYGKKNIFYSVFGVDQRKGFWGLVDYFDENKLEDIKRAEGLDESEIYKATEGARKTKLHNLIERDPKLPKLVKQKFFDANGKLFCEICSFDFSEKYGPLGDGYIEAHHKISLSKLEKAKLTTENDFTMVCANCHKMLHRKGDSIDIETLKAILKK